MWLTLSQGKKSSLTVTDRQSIWPAPDGSDAELVITTQASLTEEVLIASPRLVRLKYTLDEVAILMGLNDAPPQMWPDAAVIAGRSFETMLTDRGAIIVPGHGARLMNRHASWMNVLAEDLRSSFCLPPEGAAVGATWKLTPAFPGGLPPNTTSADFDVRYELASLTGPEAEVKVTFAIRLMVEGARRSESGQGTGEMRARLTKSRGVEHATREGRLELTTTTRRNQLIRSAMELRRA